MIRASEFVCRVAMNTEEVDPLVEVGFTYGYTTLENDVVQEKKV